MNPLCQRYYKLIIMDIGMPLKDGFDASREIIALQMNLKELEVISEFSKKCVTFVIESTIESEFSDCISVIYRPTLDNLNLNKAIFNLRLHVQCKKQISEFIDVEDKLKARLMKMLVMEQPLPLY